VTSRLRVAAWTRTFRMRVRVIHRARTGVCIVAGTPSRFKRPGRDDVCQTLFRRFDGGAERAGRPSWRPRQVEGRSLAKDASAPDPQGVTRARGGACPFRCRRTGIRLETSPHSAIGPSLSLHARALEGRCATASRQCPFCLPRQGGKQDIQGAPSFARRRRSHRAQARVPRAQGATGLPRMPSLLAPLRTRKGPRACLHCAPAHLAFRSSMRR